MFVLKILILVLINLLLFPNYVYCGRNIPFLRLVKPKGEVDKFKLALEIREEIRNSNFSSVTVETSKGIITHNLASFKFVRTMVDVSTIRFLLYTKYNRVDHQFLNLAKERVKSSHFNPKREVKIIIHSWLLDTHKNFPSKMRDAYLKKGDINVIVIDYSKIANNVFYPWTVVQTKSVGQHIAKFLEILINCGVSPKHMHIIAFGLGCHIAGFVGECITPKIARITALDPAGAGFLTNMLSALGGSGKLTYDHADFVDVIHTNCGLLGINDRVGHADFYPNGGQFQPGCGTLLSAVCSHLRAFLYYEESIGQSIFPADPCGNTSVCCDTDTVLMGDPASPSLWGDYCLTTSGTRPFGKPAFSPAPREVRYTKKHRTYEKLRTSLQTLKSSVCVIDAPRKLIVLLASNIFSFIFLYVIY